MFAISLVTTLTPYLSKANQHHLVINYFTTLVFITRRFRAVRSYENTQCHLLRKPPRFLRLLGLVRFVTLPSIKNALVQ